MTSGRMVEVGPSMSHRRGIGERRVRCLTAKEIQRIIVFGEMVGCILPEHLYSDRGRNGVRYVGICVPASRALRT
jgi:hypothetical protein